MNAVATDHANRLALGTVQFGLSYGIANVHGRVSLAETTEILKYGQARGIDTLDTAVAYGDCEERLGEIGVDGWNVVSKLPPMPVDCLNVDRWVEEAVTRSLERLRASHLSGLLMHRPSQLLERDGDALYRALVRLRDRRLVDRIGISIYDPQELDDLPARYRFDVVQAPFNLLDHRLADSGWLHRLAGDGTELHVRSVFLQGLLLMPNSARPRSFDRWAAIWRRYERWLMDAELTPLEACLRYVLSFHEIDRIIVGVDSLQQFQEIVVAMDGQITELPPELSTTDVELVNPGKWTTLST